MGRLRWVLTAFAVGAAAAFALGLLRKRRLVEVTGYTPPVSATGPQAVPDPTPPEATAPDPLTTGGSQPPPT